MNDFVCRRTGGGRRTQSERGRKPVVTWFSLATLPMNNKKKKMEAPSAASGNTNRMKKPRSRRGGANVEGSENGLSSVGKRAKPDRVLKYEGGTGSTGDARKDNPDERVHWEPENWRLQLGNIRTMLSNSDTSSSRIDDLLAANTDVENKEIQEKTVPPQVRRYQVLLSLMLSSQTRERVTVTATARLQHHGCTVDSILNTSDEELGELIYPVRFWKQKVKYIKKTTQILKDKYNSDIPASVRELLALPGVGPKVAHLVMKCAWNQLTGIPVDTHVHRITNRLGWIQNPTMQSEHTRIALEKWLPRDYWNEMDHLLVNFGQQLCTSFKPHCDDCLNKELCPFGQNELMENISATADVKLI